MTNINELVNAFLEANMKNITKKVRNMKKISKYKDNKILVKFGKKVKLTKLSDDTFKRLGLNHPNAIEEGFTKTGLELVPPTVGERYWVGNFSTSPVVKIIDKNTFKSTYSTYQIEYLD